jgi:predicted enzyme related to lactoylglutathione lyase
MAHVVNVDKSVEFYSLLGFACDSRFSDERESTYYAALSSGFAELMLTRASGTIDHSQQAVLFYMYAPDVKALREHLLSKGLVDGGTPPGNRTPTSTDPMPSGPAVFDVTYPFYMTDGEIRVHDPDGYVVLIGQFDRKHKSTVSRAGSIMQVAITVSDVGQATAYYRDVVGLEFLFSAGPNLAFLRAGSVRVMLTVPQGAGAVGANSVLYFRVHDIENAFVAMLARGATQERPPQLAAKMPDHELWIGFLRDPDGNLVGIMEEKR